MVCSMNGSKPRAPGWVYVLDSDIEAHRDDDYRVFKIGRAKNLDSRMKQLGTAYAYKPTISYTFHSEDCIQAEAELHSLFAEQRLNGEWFRLGLEDLGFISDYAGNLGYFETATGEMIEDPERPFDENRIIELAIAELESNPQFALRAKYLPFNSSHDLPQCLIETEDLVGEEEDAVRDGQDSEDYHQAEIEEESRLVEQAEIEEWNRRQKMEEESLMESEVEGY